MEFLRARADDRVVVDQLAEVDARLGDVQVDGRDRRQVAHEQHRQAFTGHLVDRSQGQAVPVREHQPLVDPGAIRQRRGIELAHRQHHLPVLAVDLIAVVVDRDEIVVGADLLDLPERLEQRLVVPEAHVVERAAVGLDVLARQRGFAAQLALFDAVERERVARRRDVVFHERCLAHLLVRGHREALQQARVAFTAEQHDDVDGHADQHAAIRSAHGRRRREHGRDQRGDHQCECGRHARVCVGVTGALDDPGGRHDFLQSAHPGAEREHQEEQSGKGCQVATDTLIDPQAEWRQRRLAGDEIERERSGRGQHQQCEAHPPDQLERRQRKHVHRRVVTEDRIGFAEGDLVPPQEDRHPLARDEGGDQERADPRQQHDERPHLIARWQRHREALARREAARHGRHGGQRDARVQREPREC